MSTPRITVDDLHVRYATPGGAIDALAGLSLSVPDGELLCLVGPSGCGKTTLLRVLAGIEFPTAGSFSVRADDPQRPTTGLVFQHGSLFPWMTVADNVAYGLQLRGVPRAARRAVALRWLDTLGLARFAPLYPGQLSGGMQQRVGIARAFAYDPEVLLMDEPFAALDAQNRLLAQQLLLRRWEEQARTVVFVTHAIDEALTLGDRILVLSARPARVLAEIRVPFARPRDAVALRTDARFGALYAEIWDLLRDEVATADAEARR